MKYLQVDRFLRNCHNKEENSLEKAIGDLLDRVQQGTTKRRIMAILTYPNDSKNSYLSIKKMISDRKTVNWRKNIFVCEDCDCPAIMEIMPRRALWKTARSLELVKMFTPLMILAQSLLLVLGTVITLLSGVFDFWSIKLAEFTPLQKMIVISFTYIVLLCVPLSIYKKDQGEKRNTLIKLLRSFDNAGIDSDIVQNMNLYIRSLYTLAEKKLSGNLYVIENLSYSGRLLKEFINYHFQNAQEVSGEYSNEQWIILECKSSPCLFANAQPNRTFFCELSEQIPLTFVEKEKLFWTLPGYENAKLPLWTKHIGIDVFLQYYLSVPHVQLNRQHTRIQELVKKLEQDHAYAPNFVFLIAWITAYFEKALTRSDMISLIKDGGKELGREYNDILTKIIPEKSGLSDVKLDTMISQMLDILNAYTITYKTPIIGRNKYQLSLNVYDALLSGIKEKGVLDNIRFVVLSFLLKSPPNRYSCFFTDLLILYDDIKIDNRLDARTFLHITQQLLTLFERKCCYRFHAFILDKVLFAAASDQNVNKLLYSQFFTIYQHFFYTSLSVINDNWSQLLHYYFATQNSQIPSAQNETALPDSFATMSISGENDPLESSPWMNIVFPIDMKRYYFCMKTREDPCLEYYEAWRYIYSMSSQVLYTSRITRAYLKADSSMWSRLQQGGIIEIIYDMFVLCFHLPDMNESAEIRSSVISIIRKVDRLSEQAEGCSEHINYLLLGFLKAMLEENLDKAVIEKMDILAIQQYQALNDASINAQLLLSFVESSASNTFLCLYISVSHIHASVFSEDSGRIMNISHKHASDMVKLPIYAAIYERFPESSTKTNAFFASFLIGSKMKIDVIFQWAVRFLLHSAVGAHMFVRFCNANSRELRTWLISIYESEDAISIMEHCEYIVDLCLIYQRIENENEKKEIVLSLEKHIEEKFPEDQNMLVEISRTLLLNETRSDMSVERMSSYLDADISADVKSLFLWRYVQEDINYCLLYKKLRPLLSKSRVSSTSELCAICIKNAIDTGLDVDQTDIGDFLSFLGNYNNISLSQCDLYLETIDALLDSKHPYGGLWKTFHNIISERRTLLYALSLFEPSAMAVTDSMPVIRLLKYIIHHYIRPRMDDGEITICRIDAHDKKLPDLPINWVSLTDQVYAHFISLAKTAPAVCSDMPLRMYYEFFVVTEFLDQKDVMQSIIKSGLEHYEEISYRQMQNAKQIFMAIAGQEKANVTFWTQMASIMDRLLDGKKPEINTQWPDAAHVLPTYQGINL